MKETGQKNQILAIGQTKKNQVWCGQKANRAGRMWYYVKEGAVIAPKPPWFGILSSGFIVPFSIGQSLKEQASA